MLRLALMLVFVLLAPLCGAQQRVEVWTYHLSPPFILDNEQGMSGAFVELLNSAPDNDGRFRFELVQLPRQQVDQRLVRKQPGILLWATPGFFSPAQTANGTWSQPLLVDCQDFVSLPDTSFEYAGPDSLKGRLLGGVLGHRYAALEAAIDNGTITRLDAPTDLQNIQALLSGRLDALLIPRSTRLYYRKELHLRDLYVSATPLYKFARRLLINDTIGEEATDFLAEFLDTLPDNPEWQILLFEYGLMPIAPEQ